MKTTIFFINYTYQLFLVSRSQLQQHRDTCGRCVPILFGPPTYSQFCVVCGKEILNFKVLLLLHLLIIFQILFAVNMSIVESIAVFSFNIVNFFSEIVYFLGNIGRRKIAIDPSKHVVIITGCDSGFGALTSKELSAKGYKVVSTCMTQDGVARLQGVVEMAVLCDVTKQSDIDVLVEKVKVLLERKNFNLWALVNNAGIAPGGYIDWLVLPTWRKTMDVNFFGIVATIKAFLPLLKRTKESRIINLSSMAGHAGSPSLGAYSGEHLISHFSSFLALPLLLVLVFICVLIILPHEYPFSCH